SFTRARSVSRFRARQRSLAPRCSSTGISRPPTYPLAPVSKIIGRLAALAVGIVMESRSSRFGRRAPIAYDISVGGRGDRRRRTEGGLMVSLRRPSGETIRAFLVSQSGLGLTYEAVGATAAVPPEGYTMDHTRIKLGEGEEVFLRAR